MTSFRPTFAEVPDLNNYKDQNPRDLLDELTLTDGQNPLMAAILQGMMDKLSEARAAYFRKPVASMPFGASVEDSTMLAKLHPELRELIFETHEALSDAVFQGCRHLAVRRCLMQLLRPGDSAITGDPYAHQVLLDGVHPYEHSFVLRTHVPMVDITRDECDEGSKHFVVADIFRSQRSIGELINYSKKASASELFVIAPYDPRMWNFMGGQQLEGSYTFEWLQRGSSTDQLLVKPDRLPKRFFTTNHYESWNLYVQPYGSTEAVVYSRAEFMKLFAGAGVNNRYVETRVVRNGFAEISIIGFSDVGESTDVARTVDVETKRVIPLGHVEVRPFARDIKLELLPGRQYDLSHNMPVYVRNSYYEKAMQQFFKMRLGRDVIPAMIRHLHANSAWFVYNGAIVTAETMVDVETMCVVLEDIVQHNSRAKRMLSIMGAGARVPVQVKPVDHAVNMMRWAALKAVSNTSVSQGIKDVGSFIRSGGKMNAPDEEDLPLDGAAPLRYGDPSSTLDAEKEVHTQFIKDFAQDAMYGGPDFPYTLEREELPVDRSYLFDLRMSLTAFKSRPVALSEVQSIYDQLFPGNSMVDPTAVQLKNESGDVKFIVDVQYFKASIPLMFSSLEGYQVIPSKLRTSIGADLMGSFRALMGSLMKRNFNRPRPEAPGSRRKFVEQSVTQAFREHARPNHGMLLGLYNRDSVTVSNNAVQLWAAKHTADEVLSAATMLDMRTPDPSQYRLMPKDIAKPALSLESQGSVYVGQTVVFHSKDMISLTVGVFTFIVSRLVALFDTNIRFAFGADEHRVGQWADEYLDKGYFVNEIDIPKFDKSQDWVCFELVLYVMELMGAHPELVLFWRKATDKATVFSELFNLTFTTMFGNRSGSAATLATNCIVLLFAYLNTFSDCGIVGLLIKGDDSVLVTRRPVEYRHEQHLLNAWGFSMKRVEKKGAVGFCSGVFVKDSNGNYRLVRDVVRVIEKFGRALPVNRPASYFLDYYVSVLDTALSYEDEAVVQNLTYALAAIYGTSIDVPTLVQFVKYVSSDTITFLKVLYGLSDDQIEGLRTVDEAVETMTRIRSTRFIKAKGLIDLHGDLKLSFVDRVKIMSDWIYEA